MTEPAKIPDLSDKLVRQMVERNHEPEELWSTDGILRSVTCGQCGNTWPCPTRVALREILKNEGVKF